VLNEGVRVVRWTAEELFASAFPSFQGPVFALEERRNLPLAQLRLTPGAAALMGE